MARLEHGYEFLLRQRKYPQLFISPEAGFFVDDDPDFIKAATDKGWPETRAVLCYPNPERGDVEKVARAIAAA